MMDLASPSALERLGPRTDTFSRGFGKGAMGRAKPFVCVWGTKDPRRRSGRSVDVDVLENDVPFDWAKGPADRGGGSCLLGLCVGWKEYVPSLFTDTSGSKSSSFSCLT